jgi:RHS repeat-associated protein
LSSTAGGIARTYAYDAAGNTTSYASNAYTFNQRGRMSKVLVGTNETDYIYNALGQLIRKSGAGGTTLLMYDEAGHLLGEYTAAGALIQETVWMDDTPVATLRPNGSTGCTSTVCIFYVHSDHLGTPRKVTRPSDNALMWRWDPDTFGSVAPNQNPGGVGIYLYNLRFPGQYSLNESGLYYNYYRDLDPQTGRYIESDPIGLNGGSFSTYAYAGGNPVGDSDPSGLLVRGGGWSDKEWSDIQRAEAKIRKELAKSCSCHKNGADGCIPCDLSESLLNRLDTMVVIYRSLNGDCGATPPVANPKGFALSRKAWKCGGCLASTIYHELLHTTGLLDPEAPELEDKCIGNLCEGSK